LLPGVGSVLAAYHLFVSAQVTRRPWVLLASSGLEVEQRLAPCTATQTAAMHFASRMAQELLQSGFPVAGDGLWRVSRGNVLSSRAERACHVFCHMPMRACRAYFHGLHGSINAVGVPRYLKSMPPYGYGSLRYNRIPLFGPTRRYRYFANGGRPWYGALDGCLQGPICDFLSARKQSTCSAFTESIIKSGGSELSGFQNCAPKIGGVEAFSRPSGRTVLARCSGRNVRSVIQLSISQRDTE